MKDYLKNTTQEVLAFTHAFFLVFFMFTGYELIFGYQFGRPVDIIFGIIIGGYAAFTVLLMLKKIADSMFDRVWIMYQIYKDQIQKTIDENTNQDS